MDDPPKQLQKTFAIIKPDAVAAGRASEIMQIIELSGFTIIAKEHLQLTSSQAERFYAEHRDKPFFAGLVSFMTSGPVWALVLAREDAIKAWRQLMGPTNTQAARESAPKSLRAMYGTDGTRNATHGSDSPSSAAREIKFFFPRISAAEVLMPEQAAEFMRSQLEPTLLKALTALARQKCAATQAEALTFLAKHLLDNNPNKGRQLAPGQALPGAQQQGADDSDDFEFGEEGSEVPLQVTTVVQPKAESSSSSAAGRAPEVVMSSGSVGAVVEQAAVVEVAAAE